MPKISFVVIKFITIITIIISLAFPASLAILAFDKPSVSFGRLIRNERMEHFPSKEEMERQPTAQVLGVSTANQQTSEAVFSPNSKTYTIAVLGDSMVETLGPGLWSLQTALKTYYPRVSFNLLNYGNPATDAEFGLYRLTNDFDQMGKRYPSLLSQRPDVVVIESFAYNPWGQEQNDLDRHWLTIAKMIDAIKIGAPSAKIVLAATIAPNAPVFGDGALNWDDAGKWTKVNTIKKYLENIINFANSQHYPLADAYHPSLGSDGNGILKYINAGDHLHPSGPGGMLFSQKIAEAIWNNNLLN